MLELILDNPIALLALFACFCFCRMSYVSGIAEGQRLQRYVSDLEIERATMALLGKDFDPSPEIDWNATRSLTVNQWRQQMRIAFKRINFLGENHGSTQAKD